ncbi:DNA polymerase III subunit chi family protein [Actinomyces sp. oral taxon 170 str. F0386]|nr:DNA polymerase III subunit chi family protein [Actinomyces sp. oral taxon 170 str. F0386]
MSATHSSFGLNALTCLLTRSAGHWSFGAERVVLGDLARLTPCRPRSPMSRTGGTAGHVTGTVTLSDLGSAPHHVHLAGPSTE